MEPSDHSNSSLKFGQAMRQVADWLNLGTDAVVEGQPIELAGVTFRLEHHGLKDPGGATLLVDYGEVAPGQEELVLRQLLEFNISSPAGLQGYFGLSRSGDRVLYCLRIDLDSTPDAAEAIGNALANTVETMHDFAQAMVRQADSIQSVQSVQSHAARVDA
jgi:hypothetical protein